MMKKVFLLALVATIITACQQNPTSSLPDKPQKINYPIEEQETVSNDFTLVKACVGVTQSEAETLLIKHGYSLGADNKYLKSENGIIKEVQVYAQGNVSMIARSNKYQVGKPVFAQWIQEMQQSAAYKNMVRSHYQLRVGWDVNGKHNFSQPDELLASLDTLSVSLDNMSAGFDSNDKFANQYSIFLHPQLGGVYLQIINQRVGQPSDDFTESDLQETDLHKHILISKVDYLTFRYKGFYALNVNNKQTEGKDIPFIAEYVSPADFGSIKLFYGTKNNLLIDGTIVWNGCGRLAFPEQFRAGLPTNAGVAYPGAEHIAMIGDDGQYLPLSNEREIKYIWESVSKQKEFQHYYTNSTKKVAVYLYTPSVGLMNPADAYYLVFVEQ